MEHCPACDGDHAPNTCFTCLERGDEIARLRADVARRDIVIGRLVEWTHTYGAALCPGHHPDTFGEGMREAKDQVRQLLSAVQQDSAG